MATWTIDEPGSSPSTPSGGCGCGPSPAASASSAPTTVGARTISGTVTLDVSTPGAGDIRVTTVSGDVTIRLPQASDLQVQVQSTSGQVASAFDELHREGQPALRSIRGRLGAGTGRLQASTTSGHVALLRREPEARESR